MPLPDTNLTDTETSNRDRTTLYLTPDMREGLEWASTRGFRNLNQQIKKYIEEGLDRDGFKEDV